MPMNPVVHAAERAAFSKALDAAIHAVRGKGPEKMAENAVRLVDLAQPLLSRRFPEADWDAVRSFVSDPDGKWMQFAYRAINEIDPHILKMNALNLAYEGMFAGYNYVEELREQYDCNMPWILLFDPTSACNLHCKGCWAAEYGNKLNLSYEDMEKIVTEGEALGIHWFGTSICYTSANYKAVTSDAFMDMLIDHGVRFNWYFHYMPIGDGANVDLMLNAEQRAYMVRRVREIRGYTGGKPIFCIDFQNDGEFVEGCIAGGKQYAHINPAGDVEPCVFIHYSGANIHDKSLLECLQQPLFKEYHKGQPFNGNHLRPCPMLENPELLGEMVARSGAHSTDLEKPEGTGDVYRRCKPYADQWTPEADNLWAQLHPECAACTACQP